MISLAGLLQTLGPQALAVVKRILLEKRIVFYFQPVAQASQSVVAFASLLPGALDSIGPPRALVEKLAAYIADAFLRRWPHVYCLTVSVMKGTGLLHFDEAQRATLARMRATFLVSSR